MCACSVQARVAKVMRKATPVVAASRVLNAIQRLQDHLKDDTTIVVVDIEPPGFDRSQVGYIMQPDIIFPSC